MGNRFLNFNLRCLNLYMHVLIKKNHFYFILSNIHIIFLISFADKQFIKKNPQTGTDTQIIIKQNLKFSNANNILAIF